MRHAFQFKINFTGGIISPGYLYTLLGSLREAGLTEVRFGLRQQLLIDASAREHDKVVAALDALQAVYEINKDDYPNISSSYPAAEIFIKTPGWERVFTKMYSTCLITNRPSK